MMRTRSARDLAAGSVALALVVLAGCSSAESSEAGSDQPAANEEATSTSVPAGTTMTFSVDQTVSTDQNSVGDHFTATLRSDVVDSEGDDVIGQGTPSRWIVTQSSTEGDQTLLAVQLDAIRIGGEWQSVEGTVTQADLHVDQGDTGGETAAKIGVGAAAGAIIGQILGKDTESTLAGAGVGAAVGTAVALTTRGGSATLPAGSSITVQLDQPLVLS